MKSRVQASKSGQDASSANVQARLFKAEPVRKVIRDAVDAIRQVLSAESDEDSGKQRLRAADLVEHDEHGNTARLQVSNGHASSSSSSDQEWEGCSTINEPNQLKDDLDTAAQGSPSSSEDEYRQYDARLAGSTDSDSSDLDDSSKYHHTRSAHLAESISEEDDSLGGEDNPTTTSQTKPSAKSPKRTAAQPTKTTTFLPSLAMSGYYSGDDDDDDDNAFDNEDTSQPQPRKNRMGQQARRALWEKKFGKKANHVKNPNPTSNSTTAGARRDAGWDPKRGASASGSRTRRKDARGGERRARGAGATGANMDPVVGRQRRIGAAGKENAKEGGLHPSWEAARKVKEQKQSAAFQGKKVIF